MDQSREELLYRNLLLLDAAAVAASHLAAEGIPALLYKGVALFDGIIPLDARACSDADLFLPAGTHHRARGVLKRAGFSVFNNESRRRRVHPAGAVIAPNGCAVDLHDALAQPGRFTPPPAVFGRAVRIRTTKAPTYRMADVDLLLSAAANLAKDEFVADPSRLKEFALLCHRCIRSRTAAVDIWAMASRWHLRPALAAATRWAIGFGRSSDEGVRLLRAVAKLSPPHELLLDATFDFSKQDPMRYRPNRRVGQAIAIPLLTSKPRRLVPTLTKVASAVVADEIASRWNRRRGRK